MSLLEKDKMMTQLRFTEYQRKSEQEAEKRRNLENEGEPPKLCIFGGRVLVTLWRTSDGVLVDDIQSGVFFPPSWVRLDSCILKKTSDALQTFEMNVFFFNWF